MSFKTIRMIQFGIEGREIDKLELSRFFFKIIDKGGKMTKSQLDIISHTLQPILFIQVVERSKFKKMKKTSKKYSKEKPARKN